MSLSRVAGGAACLGCAALAFACGSAPRGSPTESEVNPVVYGADDRRELSAVEDEALRALGAQSVVAIVEDTTVATLATAGKPGALRAFEAPSWAARRGLCAGVRFSEQPAAATCSGVLVGDDLVLTAGHCARGLDCSTLSVVFGFHYDGAAVKNELDADDVYRCREVVTFEVPNATARLDYGFLRLDRPAAAPRRAALLAQNAEALSRSAALTALGFGGGVPLKTKTVPISDARAEVLDYFVTALDAFEGDSGGPVVSADGTVVGVIAGGQSDYRETAAGCTDIVADSERNAAERVTYAFQARAALCSSETPDSALCGAPEAHAVTAGCRVARPRADPTGLCVLLSGVLLAATLARRRLSFRAMPARTRRSSRTR